MFKRNKLNTNKVQYAIFWGTAIALMIYAFVLAYPFVKLFISSFMNGTMEYNAKLKGFEFPEVWMFSNYRKALDFRIIGGEYYFKMYDMIVNTLLVTIIRAIFSIVFPVCSAYICAKYPSRFTKFYFFYGVVFCSIPLYGGSSALFKLLYALNIYDSIYAVILMSIAPFANFLFYYGFFRGIDWGYAEAAFIDGAKDFRVFWQIMLPQVLPAIFVFTINTFIGCWNDWMTSYLYYPSRPMISYGLYAMYNEAKNGKTASGDEISYPIYFAMVFLSSLAPLCIFIAFSKKILNTAYVGGLKG